jgi:transcriptional regulator with XRE-family HTH domain
VNRPRAQRIADQVHFDITRFSYDVDRALIREDTTIRGLAATINVSLSALLKFFRGEGGISLDTAAALAEWADLRLDDYVKGRTTAGESVHSPAVSSPMEGDAA